MHYCSKSRLYQLLCCKKMANKHDVESSNSTEREQKECGLDKNTTSNPKIVDANNCVGELQVSTITLTSFVTANENMSGSLPNLNENNVLENGTCRNLSYGATEKSNLNNGVHIDEKLIVAPSTPPPPATKSGTNHITLSPLSDAPERSPNISSSGTKSRKPKKVLKSSIDLHSLNEEDLQKLENKCPDVTDAERRRFLFARKGDYDGALSRLKSYVEWRKDCNLDDDEEEELPTSLSSMASENTDDGFMSCVSSTIAQDEMDWKNASRNALKYYGVSQFDGTNLLPQLASMVTCVASDSYLKDTNDERILQFLPAQIDIKIADEAVYALCIALYLDKKLRRNSTEKIAVTIDVRPGHGWKNPPAKALIPFIKKVVSLLEMYFPERLSRSLVFPLPRAAAALWHFVKVFLDPNTASKIVIISGGASIDYKLPHGKFEKYIDKSVLERMERVRRASFQK
mmetsp:Transcript_12853/g.14503  ORF Transcript_12853/g.14503 Transcript_12853/m.14503 type:complete len:458 (+) Transcript_12853:208-1581(+)